MIHPTLHRIILDLEPHALTADQAADIAREAREMPLFADKQHAQLLKAAAYELAWSVARSSFASSDSAADLYGDCVAYAARKIATFDPEAGALSTWCRSKIYMHTITRFRSSVVRVDGRRLRTIRRAVDGATAVLTARLRRTPTAEEVAEFINGEADQRGISNSHRRAPVARVAALMREEVPAVTTIDAEGCPEIESEELTPVQAADIADREEMLKALGQALDKLKRVERDAVLLHARGFNAQQIAEELEIGEEEARHYVRRAMALLRATPELDVKRAARRTAGRSLSGGVSTTPAIRKATMSERRDATSSRTTTTAPAPACLSRIPSERACVTASSETPENRIPTGTPPTPTTASAEENTSLATTGSSPAASSLVTNS